MEKDTNRSGKVCKMRVRQVMEWTNHRRMLIFQRLCQCRTPKSSSFVPILKPTATSQPIGEFTPSKNFLLFQAHCPAQVDASLNLFSIIIRSLGGNRLPFLSGNKLGFSALKDLKKLCVMSMALALPLVLSCCDSKSHSDCWKQRHSSSFDQIS